MDLSVGKRLGSAFSHRLTLPLCILVGGGLWAASLPPYGQGMLVIPALALLMIPIPGVTPGRAAAWGWFAGFLWEGLTLWWLIPTMVRYGGMEMPLAVLLFIGLSAYLGLFMSLFLGVLAQLARGYGVKALAFAPFLWVLVEWLRGRLFTGLPWWGPGYGLSLYEPLLQGAKFLGILGLSLLALFASTAIAVWVRERSKGYVLVVAIVPLVLFVILFFHGRSVVHEESHSPPVGDVRVGFLQPAIRQDLKWDTEEAERIRERLIQMTLAFRKYGLGLLVWPESCTPDSWDLDEDLRSAVYGASLEIDAPILLGSIVRAEGGKHWSNGAVLVLPEGLEGGRYAKTHLVPYGEYVPMRSWLTFANPIIEQVGDWVPGESLDPLPSPIGNLGITICYEGIFPDLVRKQVLSGAEILVNVTNDAWYEGTPGPYQHFFMERVRAVEMGRFMIRSANGGFSGIVTPAGRLSCAVGPDEEAAFWGKVKALRKMTPFARIGESWLLLCLLIVLAGIADAFRRRRRGASEVGRIPE